MRVAPLIRFNPLKPWTPWVRGNKKIDCFIDHAWQVNEERNFNFSHNTFHAHNALPFYDRWNGTWIYISNSQSALKSIGIPVTYRAKENLLIQSHIPVNLTRNRNPLPRVWRIWCSHYEKLLTGIYHVRENCQTNRKRTALTILRLIRSQKRTV